MALCEREGGGECAYLDAVGTRAAWLALDFLWDRALSASFVSLPLCLLALVDCRPWWTQCHYASFTKRATAKQSHLLEAAGVAQVAVPAAGLWPRVLPPLRLPLTCWVAAGVAFAQEAALAAHC
jgi:hypothetical protein